MIWLISDEHYGHRKIFTYTNRPWNTVEEMDGELLRRTNAVMNRPDDIMYHLGDFAFGNKTQLSAYRASLAGKHVLIRGNHDRGIKAMLEAGFDAVVNEVVLGHDGRRVLLTHQPQDTRGGRFDFVCHGHVHHGKPDDLAKAGENPLIEWWNFNCCVEALDYSPISLDTVVRKLKKREGKQRNE